MDFHCFVLLYGLQFRKRDTLVLEHGMGIMRLAVLTLVFAVFALLLVNGSVIAEDEVVED